MPNIAQPDTPVVDASVVLNANPWPSPLKGWYVVIILLLAYMLSFIDRQILTLMVDPIKQDLQLTDTQFSLLHGLAFALFYSLLGLPLGRLVDQYERRKIVGYGILCWTLMTTFCGLARNYTQLFFARIGVGVGEAALSPAAYSLISDYFPKEKLPRALSVYALGISGGVGFAYLLGGPLIAFANNIGSIQLPFIGELRPWQLVFIMVGLPGVLFSALAFTITEPARRNRAVQTDGKGVPLREVFRFLGKRRLFFFCFLSGLSLMAALGHGVLGWLPAYYMRTHQWDPGQTGIVLGLVAVIFITGGLYCGGWITEKLQQRGINDATLRVAAASCFLCAPFGVIAPMFDNAIVSVLLFAVFQFFQMMPWGIAPAAIQVISPNEMRGQFSALYLFSINIVGLGLGPTLIAGLTDYVFLNEAYVGYALATACAVFAPLSGLLLLFGLSGFNRALAESDQWK